MCCHGFAINLIEIILTTYKVYVSIESRNFELIRYIRISIDLKETISIFLGVLTDSMNMKKLHIYDFRTKLQFKIIWNSYLETIYSRQICVILNIIIIFMHARTHIYNYIYFTIT